MPAPVIPDATFPIPPPVAHLPIVQPGNGTFTPVGLELFTKIWAAIQGGGGVYPSIQVLQQEVATIFAMHGDGTLSSDGVLTVTKTQGVPFGYFATGTDASHLTGTVPVAALPIATIATVGVVKPDGTTITIDPDGTIHSAGGAGVSITGTDGNLVFTPDPITGAGDIDFAPNINVTGYLNVGSAGPPANTNAGDLTGRRLFLSTTLAAFITQFGWLENSASPMTATAGGAVFGLRSDIHAAPAANSSSEYRFLSFSGYLDGTYNFNTVEGGYYENRMNTSGSVTIATGLKGIGITTSSATVNFGTIATIEGVQGKSLNQASGTAATGTVTSASDFHAVSPTFGGNIVVATQYGLLIDSQKVTGVTKGYGVNQVSTADLNVFAGATTIGAAADPTASAVLDLNSTTGALLIPRMTTTQRLALTPSNGMEVYDTTVGAFFDFTAGAWVQRGSGGGGGGYSPGTVPTVVQVAFSVNGGNSATFANPPTNGNLLVAMSFNPTSNVVGTGWTRQTSNGTGTDFGNVLTKVAGAGESATQSPMSGISTTGGMVIWEIAGQNATTPYIFGISQSEQTAASNTPLLAPNLTNGLGLSCVALVTTPTIVLAANLGTQDILDNSGTRKLAAGHTDLSKTPMVGVVSTFSASGNSKGATCIISS